MDIIVKIFYSIFFIAMGYWILRYRKVVKSWTWNFVWAEQYLWRGWTYFILLLVWIGLIFFWAIYPFWWLELFN